MVRDPGARLQSVRGRDSQDAAAFAGRAGDMLGWGKAGCARQAMIEINTGKNLFGVESIAATKVTGSRYCVKAQF